MKKPDQVDKDALIPASLLMPFLICAVFLFLFVAIAGAQETFEEEVLEPTTAFKMPSPPPITSDKAILSTASYDVSKAVKIDTTENTDTYILAKDQYLIRVYSYDKNAPIVHWWNPRIAYADEANGTNLGDGWMYSPAPTANNSTTYYSYIGTFNEPGNLRHFIGWTMPTIAEQEGYSVQIDSVEFFLRNIEMALNDTAMTVYETDRTAVENQATWNVYSTGNSWTTAGGDLDTEVDTFTAPTVNNWATIQLATSTEMGVDHWYIIKQTSEGTDQDYWAIATKEHTTTAYRPYLDVMYTYVENPTSTPSATTTTATSTDVTEAINYLRGTFLAILLLGWVFFFTWYFHLIYHSYD